MKLKIGAKFKCNKSTTEYIIVNNSNKDTVSLKWEDTMGNYDNYGYDLKTVIKYIMNGKWFFTFVPICEKCSKKDFK